MNVLLWVYLAIATVLSFVGFLSGNIGFCVIALIIALGAACCSNLPKEIGIRIRRWRKRRKKRAISKLKMRIDVLQSEVEFHKQISLSWRKRHDHFEAAFKHIEGESIKALNLDFMALNTADGFTPTYHPSGFAPGWDYKPAATSKKARSK